MKSIILIFLLSIIANINLFSNWEPIERPLSISNLENINSGGDFLIGSKFDPFFSFDGGKTWELRNNGLPQNRGPIQKIIVENNIIFIQTMISFIYEQEYLCYSTNYGKDWNIIETNLNQTSDIYVDNSVIYKLPYSSNFLIKSSNLGITWDTIPDTNKKLERMNLIIARNDTIIIADEYIQGSNIEESLGLMISFNGGKNWIERNNGISTYGITCIKLYKNYLFVGYKDGFYISDDLGISYKRAYGLAFNVFVNKIGIINDSIYLATDNGLIKSDFQGRTWEEFPKFKLQKVVDLHFGLNRLFVSSHDRNYFNYYSYISENLNSFEILNYQQESPLFSFSIYPPKIYFSTYNFTQNFILKKNKIEGQLQTISNGYTNELLKNLSSYNSNVVCNLMPLSSNINNTLLISKNEGENWITKENIIENINIMDVFLLNNDTIIVATLNGVYISPDFAESWELFKIENNELNEYLTKIKNIKKLNNKIYFYGEGSILETDTNLSNWKSLLNPNNNPLNDKLILTLSKHKNNIFAISFKGQFIEHSTVDLLVSRDNGESWKNIKGLFSNFNDIVFKDVFNINNYVFLSSNKGIFFSSNNGNSWEEINEGLSVLSKINGGEFHLYYDKILFCSISGIFYRPLSELGITLSTEKTEKRNYLWTYPPYPHPTNNIVKVDTYWDSALPFSEKDVEIYDITGLRVNTNETLTLQKESNYKGQIIWDVSSQNPGIYIMKITHGTETRVRKIMVVE